MPPQQSGLRFVLLTGQLVREVSITALPPQVEVTAMQMVIKGRHESQLALATSGSEKISLIQINDAVATETLLAGRFAAMHVDPTGKPS